MEEVNWPVFQAAAALVGGKMAADKNNRIDLAIENDLAPAYEALMRSARHLQQKARDDERQALAARGQKPMMDLGD